MLEGGRVTDPIPPAALRTLLLEIAARPGGWDVAIGILYMRLFSDESQKQVSAPEIIDTGRELMLGIDFTNSNIQVEYKLGLICKQCLRGDGAAEIVRSVCRKFRDAVTKYETYIFYHEELLQGLFSVQPTAALDGFCSGDTATNHRAETGILRDIGQLRGNPLYSMPEDELFNWCDLQPKIRYPAMAAAIAPFYLSGDKGQPQWTSIARGLIEKAPEPVEVLKRFVGRIIPTSWVGSRSAIVKSNAVLLDDFAEHPDPAVREFIANEKAKLPETINAEQNFEELIEQQIDERFE